MPASKKAKGDPKAALPSVVASRRQKVGLSQTE